VIVPLAVDIADIPPYRLIFAIDLELWQIYNQTTARLVDKLGALWLRRGFFLKGVAVQNNPANRSHLKSVTLIPSFASASRGMQ
jgi:hypothetical protein